MLDLLDILLHDVLKAGVKSLASGLSGAVSDDRISSSAPDGAWRESHTDPTKRALSVYLVELREHTKLRSNERVERLTDKGVVSRRAPYRMDCHYLISAFDPGAETAMPPPPIQREHKLLYEATAALADSRPLIPSHFYPGGTAHLSAWPEAFRDHELLMDINPAAGFAKLSEFWSTLPGKQHPWRPCVYLVVTVPVEMLEYPPIQIVHQQITNFDQQSSRHPVARIGGVVLDLASNPVPRAWVILEDSQHVEVARTTTGDDGKYVLTLNAPGQILYAAAFGLGKSPAINVLQVDDFTLQFK